MSEIQSIAQNNYILTTQQEVSHDNTLSGNGTVDSPLGVVNGYNETVLYSGNIPAINSNINLSETWNNFQYVDVSLGYDNPCITRYATTALSDTRVAFKFCYAYNYMQEGFIKLTPTEDEKVWTYESNTLIQYHHTNKNITVLNNDSTYITTAQPLKIVGINRKQ